jgi:hypothetical protein
VRTERLARSPQLISGPRRHQSLPRVRRHVRHAALPALLGGRTAHGPESPLLYIPQRWLPDAIKGRCENIFSKLHF